jgi:hypothetical protein
MLGNDGNQIGGSARVSRAGSGVAPETLLDKSVFRRDADNGNRDGRAPHFKLVAADVNRLIILRAVF